MFYFVLIVTGTMSHDPISNLGQRVNTNKLSFQLIVNVMNSNRRKKVKCLIIVRTTFRGTDACAYPELLSRGSEGYFSLSEDGIRGILEVIILCTF